MTARRGGGGFSLAELAVSLFLISLVLLLCGQLLQEAHLAFLASSRELREPEPLFALRLLRGDLRRARSVAGGSFSWSAGALRLARTDGSRVVYRRAGVALERQPVDPAGEPAGTWTVLQGAAGWRWRQISPGLVEVEIAYLRPGRRPGPTFAGLHQLRPAPPVPEALRIRVALRAPPGRRGW